MENVLLTVDEIAKILRVHKSWVYARTRDKGPKRIPYIKVGKYCRFDADSVLEWIKNNQTA